MELRFVDPKTLLDNPENPRRAAPNAEEDRRLALNIQVVGLLQPPVVRELPEGALQIVFGHRRRRAAIQAKLKEIPVLVSTGDEELDRLAAGSENMVRQGMGEPEQWSFVQSLRESKGLTDRQICKALMITPAYLKQLGLLARLHPPILDAIALGHGPEGRERAAIAKATPEEQAASWAGIWAECVEGEIDPAQYRMTPEEAQDFDWRELALHLSHNEFFARDAAFDNALAKTHGIVWEEDLFAPADQDNRYTRDALRYEAAQRDWIETQLGEADLVVEVDAYGSFVMPEGTRRVWYDDETLPRVYAVHPRTLKVVSAGYVRQNPSGSSGALGVDCDAGSASSGPVAKTRPDISGTGLTMIGDIRTGALHAALDAIAPAIDPWDLVAGLLLAFSANNVSVQGDPGGRYGTDRARDAALAALFPEGLVVRDPALIRQHAIAVLKSVANCRTSLHSGSGITAQLLGLMVDADAQMPDMAVEDFLKTYSKPGITKALQAERLLPRNTGKDMRAALIAHVGQGCWVPPEAGFAQAAEAWKAQLAQKAERAARWARDDADDEERETDPDDEAPEADGGEDDQDEGSPDIDPDSASDTGDRIDSEADTDTDTSTGEDNVVAAEDGNGVTEDPGAGGTLPPFLTRIRDDMTLSPEGRAHFDSHVAFMRVA